MLLRVRTPAVSMNGVTRANLPTTRPPLSDGNTTWNLLTTRVAPPSGGSDGTRFVAGLVATPLIQFYDATQNSSFLRTRLVPYLKDVAAFYSSYAVADASSGRYELPFTCSQEICNGHSPQLVENNNHQDIAYARMAYEKLLEYTDPHGVHGADATPAERQRWRKMLDGFTPFPLSRSEAFGQVFAEALAPPSGPQPAAESNAGYPITHRAPRPARAPLRSPVLSHPLPPSPDSPSNLMILVRSAGLEHTCPHHRLPVHRTVAVAALHPAQVIDRFTAAAPLLEAARNTVNMINNVTAFAPGNGFVLSWPAAAMVADGTSGASLLAQFSTAFLAHAKPNGWPDLGGGGLEQIGAIAALQLMLVRVVDGVLRLFPGWPVGAPRPASLRTLSRGERASPREDTATSFEQLRVSGAFLVSASRRAGGEVVAPVRIFSEAGRSLLVPHPFAGSAPLCARERESEKMLHLTRAPEGSACANEEMCYVLQTEAGTEYGLMPCYSGHAVPVN